MPPTKDVAIVTPKPWEQQENETAHSFAAFVAYRDLPPNKRTYAAVTEILYPNSEGALRNISGWGLEFKWDARAKAWDAEVDSNKLTIQLSAVRTMEARHVQLAIALQQKGLAALEALSEKVDISAADARLMITEGAKLERLSRDKATEITEEKGGPVPHGELSKYTDEQLAQLEEAAQRDK